MGLFSSIAGIFSANAKGKAAKKASAAQIAAAQQGIDAVTAQNTASQANFAPFIETGTQALGAQSDLLGLGGGDEQQAAITALQDSPLFQSLFRTGQETILQNGSATGGLRGGNIQSSLANFGSDTLAKVIQQQLSNLGGLAGQGLDAAGTGGAIGAEAAAAIAKLFGDQGQAKAGGILGKANAQSEMFGNIAGGLGSLASSFLPTGGLGGKLRGLI